MLSRILSQYLRVWVGNDLYLYEQNIPWDLQQEAEELRDIFLSKNRFDKFVRKDDVIPRLIKRGLLAENYKVELQKLNTQQSNTLIALYKNFEIPGELKKNRERLSQIRHQIYGFQVKIYSYQFNTVESIADQVMEDFIISRVTKTIDNIPIEDSVIDDFKSSYHNRLLSLAKIRECARTDYWKSCWLTCGSSCFPRFPLTDMQVGLAMFSRMYENVYQHPECPSHAVIEDDDALDGWFLFQNQDRKKHSIPSKPGQETFIFAEDQDEANAIYATNSEESKAVQRLRMQQLQQNKVMKHKDFSDVKGMMRVNKR